MKTPKLLELARDDARNTLEELDYLVLPPPGGDIDGDDAANALTRLRLAGQLPANVGRYMAGVHWIADNDAPGDADALEPETVRSYISTLLLADLFGKAPEVVARDIVRVRKQEREGR